VLGNPVILRGLKNYGAGWNTISTSVKDTFIYNVPIHQNAEFIQGIHGSAFVFDLGSLCIAHLGDLSQKLNDQQIKAFGKVDVALTPIGGRRTMDPELAREVLAQLKPKIAIPMHHRDNQSLVQQFSAGMRTQVLPGDTLGVSKNALPQPTPNQSTATARRSGLSVIGARAGRVRGRDGKTCSETSQRWLSNAQILSLG
jgi:hypothetical protein